LLNSAARGFTAEVGTHPSYTEHEVVIDLLAITPTLLLGEPFNWTAEEFLTLYKKTNDLAYLPNPTAEQHLLEEIILKVNILCRKEPTIIVIDEDNPASNTITNTTTTTAATTTP
jgi:histidinol-phosphate/aromatic aminotransferase/cobyric acid decarboxylase-like protein